MTEMKREEPRHDVTSSENKVLGVLLNEPSYMNDIERMLTDEMFSIEAHKIIYRKMTSLRDENLLPDFNLLKNYLESAGLLGAVGGEEYLNYLKDCPEEADYTNLKKYVSIINKAFKSREVLKIGKYVKKLEDNYDVVELVVQDIKDRIDYIDTKGTSGFVSRLSNLLQPAWENIKEKIENPGIIGLPTGYKSIESITGGYRKGNMWIIGGRPSHGKTAFVLNSMYRGAKKGVRTLLFSLEMNEQQIVERLVSIATGIDHIKIMLGNLSKGEADVVKRGFKELNELPIFISTDFELDAGSITKSIKEEVKENEIDTVWIDYVQLTTDRETEAVHTIGRISRTCKLLSKELNIFIGLVSQLNRKVEQRENKRPVKADLRQSGNLEEDADLIAFIYRDEIYNKDDESNEGMLEFIVDKHRNGPIGTLMMQFYENTMRIKDYG